MNLRDMGTKLDNSPVLNNDFLVEYNKIALDLNNLQEAIYELFSKNPENDESIPFDANDHEYNMDFSYSDLLMEDLDSYREMLDNGEISIEDYNKFKRYYTIVDDKHDKAEEVINAFAHVLQLLFNLIAEFKDRIDKKIINESIYYFKSNIEDLIKKQGKIFQTISSNANIDLKEIDKSPYMYIYNTLTREAQRISKSYEIACLQENIHDKLRFLGYIDFSDLNLLSKFEDTIEKYDLNLGTIEMLDYYKYMFEENIRKMGDNISFTKVIKYKTKLLQIVKINIENVLFNFDFDIDNTLGKEFIGHLELVEKKLESDIALLQKSTTKYDKELLKFPNLSNIVKIYKLMGAKRLTKVSELMETIDEINNIDKSKLTRLEIASAKAELDKIFNNGNLY